MKVYLIMAGVVLLLIGLLWVQTKRLQKAKKRTGNIDKILDQEQTDKKVVLTREKITADIITAKEPKDAEKIVSDIRDIYNSADF